jgi:ribosome-associated protein
MLKVNNRIQIPLREFDFTFARSGGPGGQNVNKVETKAVLYWAVEESPTLPRDVKDRFTTKYHQRITTEGILVINSERFRNKDRNMSDCMDKVKAMLLEVAVAPKKRRPTKPHKGAKEKRLRGKRENAEKKQRRGKIDY